MEIISSLPVGLRRLAILDTVVLKRKILNATNPPPSAGRYRYYVPGKDQLVLLMSFVDLHCQQIPG
jgi:hypothetical protein